MTEKENAKNLLEFSLKAVNALPKRKFTKTSKYDPLLDAIIKRLKTDELISVDVEGNPNYVRTQIDKRIDARNIKGVRLSIAQGKLYAQREK